MKYNDGHCTVNDKSDPEEIKRQFHVSKKIFKKAIGDLYKKKLITLADDGLHLA